MDKRRSILIVDDSRENLDALRGILEDTYTIYVAVNGEAALRLLPRNKPDIILLDVVMPGIDGFEVLKRIKADAAHANIPVIFITGSTDSFSESKGLLLGAVDYIVKPYNPDIVGIKVRNQLENKLYRDNLEQLVDERTEALRLSQDAIIFGMSLMAEHRDSVTGAHLRRVKNYVRLLCQHIRDENPDLLSEKDMKSIIAYSPLHDIGKVAISDTILLKPGRLTSEEFDAVKIHTDVGAEILTETQLLSHADAEDLAFAIDIARYHHEKYDGTGYPDGLAGDDIPIAARIVALADVYDALISKREYKEAFTHDAARDIILNGDDRTTPEHFDPMILNIFMRCAPDFARP